MLGRAREPGLLTKQQAVVAVPGSLLGRRRRALQRAMLPPSSVCRDLGFSDHVQGEMCLLFTALLSFCQQRQERRHLPHDGFEAGWQLIMPMLLMRDWSRRHHPEPQETPSPDPNASDT